MRGLQRDSSRAVAVSLVLALHALLLLMFHQTPRDVRSAASFVPAPSMILVPIFEEEPEPVASAPVESAPRLPVSPRPTPRDQASAPVVPEPITEPPPAPSRDWSSIDWNAEAHEAARTVIEKRKKYRSLAAHAGSKKPRGLSSKSKREFGWKQSSINRVDTSQGLPVWNVSERCALLLFVLPACVLGKIEPRGDLFEHMNDVELPEEEEE